MAAHNRVQTRTFKLTVCFEARPDGGLRAYSDDVPGLVLSSPDVDGVLEDVTEALKFILSERLGANVEVAPFPCPGHPMARSAMKARARTICPNAMARSARVLGGAGRGEGTGTQFRKFGSPHFIPVFRKI